MARDVWGWDPNNGRPIVAAPNAETSAFQTRVAGDARTGFVELRDFDRGVIETLRAFIAKDGQGLPKYWINVENNLFDQGSSGPPGLPGVPVFFANPEDVNQALQFPFVEIRRDDISPAMERWHGAAQQYRVPALGALPQIVTLRNGTQLSGYDRMEMLEQALPYDITYTISVKARYRGAQGKTVAQRNQVNAVFGYVLRIYPPYCEVDVRDSAGDIRGYNAFNEGIANLDAIAEVQDRVLGFALTLRVEAEIDSKLPKTETTVFKFPNETFNPK
jgi:hypothetical protein